MVTNKVANGSSHKRTHDESEDGGNHHNQSNGQTSSSVVVKVTAVDEQEVEAEVESDNEPMTKRRVVVAPRACPFLDTIDRHLLDFDFEKVCSVSLSNLNVYACLVCGKYFQGKFFSFSVFIFFFYLFQQY
jgi:U4/U6.U5 tri-snRNP-associated protein 2